ncbi:unnamed protein product [Eruca vesicaria subsp. sativa]|uniref:MATH domain-containing protein n=1 Tax=Eruca vesicaria subsp. sativa TaxID=29727 RepID=A0ABC8M842_ERUVS|nr:unnamed protein product [Eruca vesicaria subsp. sativa]
MLIESSFLRSMKKIGENKFAWVIKNFSSLLYETFHEHTFEIDTDLCRCRLSVTPYGNNPQYFGFRMLIAYDPSLPPGIKRHFSYRLTIVNPRSENQSIILGGPQWFDSQTMEWGSVNFPGLSSLRDKDDEVKIVAEVDVLEAIDKLYIPKKLEKTTISQCKVEEKNDAVSSVLLKEASAIKEETLRGIIERHLDNAVGFRSKSKYLRKACINSLLFLIETLCQSPKELSSEDLEQADVTLTYLKETGFKFDYLDERLDQVQEKKEKEMSCLANQQETEETLLNLKQKRSELKAKLADFKTPLSFDDNSIIHTSFCLVWFSFGRDLFTYPKGYKGDDSLVVSLAVTDGQSLPSEWARYVKFHLTIVNQLSHELSIHRETNIWFDQKAPGWGLSGMLPFAKLHDKDGGFLVNDELKIVAEVEALEVIGTLDESKDKTSTSVDESIDVNGFQVLPSQVASVRCIFEKHPDFASKVRSNSQLLKSSYINALLGLIETLCQLPDKLSDDDLDEASAAVSYLTQVGFEVDWLEKKLEEVKEKKKKVNSGKAKLEHMEKELQNLTKKCSDLKDLLEKENADLSATNVALSFNDVV